MTDYTAENGRLLITTVLEHSQKELRMLNKAISEIENLKENETLDLVLSQIE